MLSVVIGHFANQFTEDSLFLRSISLFIYSYHMPLFIFIAGLLQKKWTNKNPFRWSKPVYYILLGYLLKTGIFLIKVIFHRPARFLLFEDTGIPWYMFAMAAFVVITYAVRNVNWKVFLPMTVILALMTGYVNEIGSFLYLSRIIVFFPFYYAGYLLEPDAVIRFTRRKAVRIGSVGVIMSALLICFGWIEKVNSYIRMFTGRNAYDFIHIDDCGFEDRLLCYVVSTLMCIAIISLMPNKSLPIAGRVGRNTLQIYYWHRQVLYILMYSGLSHAVRAFCGAAWIPVYLGIAVALTYVLSIDCFGKPLSMVQKWQKKIGEAIFARRRHHRHLAGVH
ncbi:MAG: hypothetical protein LUF92_06030 [Clostridiales bacterium]|nr:hypothetical protein [Clostridiales bacterium]